MNFAHVGVGKNTKDVVAAIFDFYQRDNCYISLKYKQK